MAAPQHLQIINPSYCGTNHVSFSQFAKLPKELQLRIWECSLQHHRLIEVELLPRDFSDIEHASTPKYSTTNALNKFISGEDYEATVQGRQLHSKLLRVNRDSREVALQFYRVHFPCYRQTSQDGVKRIMKTTLYFNPEYDFIHMEMRGVVEYVLIDFLHDLKAYDPRDVGLLNLALGPETMFHLHANAYFSEGPARMSFVDTLSQIQQIIWMTYCNRVIETIGPSQDECDLHEVRYQLNLSMPVRSINPSFDLLKQDPRPLESRLKFILEDYYDPRQMRVQWQQFLEKWGIRQAQPTKERVLFAHEPYRSEEVYDIRTAIEFLKKEEESSAFSINYRHRWYTGTDTSQEELPVEEGKEKADGIQAAVGFWLFPAEALGDLEGNFARKIRNVYDMRGSWPELALSHLS